MTSYGKNLDGDTRQKDQDWAINYVSPDTARLAVQMDIRDELKDINSQLTLGEMGRVLVAILEQQKITNMLLQTKRQPKRSKRNVNARRTRRKSSKR